MDEFVIQTVAKVLSSTREQDIEDHLDSLEKHLLEKGISNETSEGQEIIEYLNKNLDNHPFFKIEFDKPYLKAD